MKKIVQVIFFSVFYLRGMETDVSAKPPIIVPTAITKNVKKIIENVIYPQSVHSEKHPAVITEIDLDKNEVILGVPYKELMEASFKRNFPYFLASIETEPAPGFKRIDFYDAFTLMRALYGQDFMKQTKHRYNVSLSAVKHEKFYKHPETQAIILGPVKFYKIEDDTSDAFVYFASDFDLYVKPTEKSALQKWDELNTMFLAYDPYIDEKDAQKRREQVDAQLKLVKLYQWGSLQDLRRALKIMESLEESIAMSSGAQLKIWMFLGRAYCDGRGVAKDPKKCRYYLEQAFKHPNFATELPKFRLASICDLGVFAVAGDAGEPRDYQKAHKYFTMMAEQSDSFYYKALGLFRIGLLLTQGGYGLSADKEAGIKHFLDALRIVKEQLERSPQEQERKDLLYLQNRIENQLKKLDISPTQKRPAQEEVQEETVAKKPKVKEGKEEVED